MEFSGFEDANISGGHCGGVTPVPISNTAVKPARADGTWRGTSWESRSPPDYSNDDARLSAMRRRALSRPEPEHMNYIGASGPWAPAERPVRWSDHAEP